MTTGPGTGETGGETGGTMGGTVGGTSTNGTITGATDETGATTTPVTTGATEDNGETGEPFVCKGTVEKLPQGNTDPPVDSGFEKCDGGIIHRAEKVACDVPATPSSCEDATGGGNCVVDADCTGKPFGTCQQDMIFGGLVGVGGTCSCTYGCQTDDDCADGQICRCGGDSLGLYTECIDGSGCTFDGDCPVGEICRLSPDICAPGGFQLACTTPNDLCASDADCMASGYADVCNDGYCGCSSAAVCGEYPTVFDGTMVGCGL